MQCDGRLLTNEIFLVTNATVIMLNVIWTGHSCDFQVFSCENLVFSCIFKFLFMYFP